MVSQVLGLVSVESKDSKFTHLLPLNSPFIRFFETEGIAILTLLVSQYRIEVKEEPQFAGETFDQRKERLLNCKPGLTITSVLHAFFDTTLILHMFIAPSEFRLYLPDVLEAVPTSKLHVCIKSTHVSYHIAILPDFLLPPSAAPKQ